MNWASKPDWKDAPEWANWLAQDFNGIWWWYQDKPSENGLIHGIWRSTTDTEVEMAGKGTVDGDWRESLERRRREE